MLGLPGENVLEMLRRGILAPGNLRETWNLLILGIGKEESALKICTVGFEGSSQELEGILMLFGAWLRAAHRVLGAGNKNPRRAQGAQSSAAAPQPLPITTSFLGFPPPAPPFGLFFGGI